MTEKKVNHQANIVRLGNPRVHPNADSLELYDIGGYQVVTKKGQFTPGDLAVYIQPDSVVPQTESFRFIWEPYAPAEVNNAGETFNPAVGDRRRRITVKRLRKEYSEGFLMPCTDFTELYDYTLGTGLKVQEGDDVSTILGITHWTGDDVENTGGDNATPRYKRPRTLKGWFYYILWKLKLTSKKSYNLTTRIEVPGFDVENLKNFKSAIKPGELVYATEKIHGSQGKFTFIDGTMYAGSRNFWKTEDSPCVWRKALKQNPWIEAYCRANEGYVLYGEVTPTQKGYRYGAADGQVKFHVFDIRDAQGNYLSKADVLSTDDITSVPLVYVGPYNAEYVASLVTGKSFVGGATNDREGLVITVADPTRWERGVGRVQLKLVSNSFLEKDVKN